MDAVKCKQRWILFYDSACPVCYRLKSKWLNELSMNIKLTVVDLNSIVAQSKGYSNKTIVLETPSGVYIGYKAVNILLSNINTFWAKVKPIRYILLTGILLVSLNKKIMRKLYRHD